VTGEDPATERQKAFIGVLEKQHPEFGGVEKERPSKGEASKAIDTLQKARTVQDNQHETAIESKLEVMSGETQTEDAPHGGIQNGDAVKVGSEDCTKQAVTGTNGAGREIGTDERKSYIAVVEKENPDLVPEGVVGKDKLNTGDAIEVIDKLKTGQPVVKTDTKVKPQAYPSGVESEGGEMVEKEEGELVGQPPVEGKKDRESGSKRSRKEAAIDDEGTAMSKRATNDKECDMTSGAAKAIASNGKVMKPTGKEEETNGDEPPAEQTTLDGYLANSERPVKRARNSDAA
jgi:hypothetical protein